MDPSKTGTTKKEKKMKRDPRSLENVMKKIANCSLEEQLNVLQDNYREMFNDYRAVTFNNKCLEKKTEILQKENENMKSEVHRAILHRTNMEDVARKLQQQNKQMKEENYNRLKEEEEKRKVVAASFTEKLNNLTTLMDENRDKSFRLREENLSMTAKLTELYNQLQDRGNCLANMNKQVELQKKLSETQMKKLEMEFEAEKELWVKEKTMFLADLERSEEANTLMQENINVLQSRIDSYQKHYCDFENTMQRSNKVFDNFMEEMQKLKQKNADLESEKEMWKSRFAGNSQTIVQLNNTTEKKREAFETKVNALDKLARRLLIERTSYLNQLKEHGINPVTPSSEEDSEVAAFSRKLTIALQTVGDMLNIPTEKQEAIAQNNEMIADKMEVLTVVAEVDNNMQKDTIDEPLNYKEPSRSREVDCECPEIVLTCGGAGDSSESR